MGGLNTPHLTHDNIRFPIYLMMDILIDSGLSDGVEITFWAIGLENLGMERSIFCSVLTLEVAESPKLRMVVNVR